MVSVDVGKYRDFDKAFRVFQTKVRQAHILELLNQKSHYISPSERRRKSRLKKQYRNA